MYINNLDRTLEKKDRKMSEDTVTLGDRRVEITNYDRYKGRKGETDRIAFLSNNLIWRKTWYVEGRGSNDRGSLIKDPGENTDLGQLIRKHLGEPEQRFGLVLFHYKADENGVPDNPDKCSGKPKLWVISESRYAQLSNIHNEFPLLAPSEADGSQHDLIIRCQEEQFQRMEFQATAKQAHYRKKDKWVETIMKKVPKAEEQLKKAMGRDYTEDEVKQLLGISSGSATPTQGSSDELDLDDVIDEDDE